MYQTHRPIPPFSRLPVAAIFALAALIGFGAPGSAKAESLRVEELRELPVPAASFSGNFLAAHVALDFHGRARDARRDVAAAAVFYRWLLVRSPDDLPLAESALIAFLAAGDMDYAIQAAEQVIEGDHEHGLAQLALAVDDIREGRYEQARERLDESGRATAQDPLATLLRAWSYAGSQLEEEALATIDTLAGEPGFELLRYYHGALVASFLGLQEEARERFAVALEMQPQALSVVDSYALFAARDERLDDALSAYDAFLEVFPRHPIATRNRADLAAGETLPRAVSSVNEGASDVLYTFASISGEGDDMVSLIYLSLGLHLAPAHDMALVLLGEYLREMEQYALAIAAYDRVPRSSPLRAGADSEIGLLLEELDRKEQAVAHLEAILERDPANLDAATALGSVQRMRENFEAAVEGYDRAIAMLDEPGSADWSLFFFRGASHERSGNWDLAEEDLRVALELVPEGNARGRAHVLNYIGYSWIDQGINLEEGYKKIQEAIALAPDSGHIRDSLGWAYYLFGEYEDAVVELERAVRLLPDDPIINDHLGDAYWKVGRKLEARFQWERALAHDPDPDDRERIEHKLELGLDAVEAAERADAGNDVEALKSSLHEGG